MDDDWAGSGAFLPPTSDVDNVALMGRGSMAPPFELHFVYYTGLMSNSMPNS